MDPVTIATSVAKITSTCLTIGTAIYDFSQKYQNAPTAMVAISSGATVISATVSHIQALILSKPDPEYLLRSRPELAATLDTSLIGCMVLFSCLEKEMQEITKYATGKDEISWKGKVKSVWKQERFQELLDGLRGQQLAINTLIQLLQMDSLLEITRLLQQKGPELKESVERTESLRSKYPSLKLAESIYSLRDRMSVLSAADTMVASSELEFAFDDIIVNSAAYRRVFATAKSHAPDPSPEPARSTAAIRDSAEHIGEDSAEYTWSRAKATKVSADFSHHYALDDIRPEDKVTKISNEPTWPDYTTYTGPRHEGRSSPGFDLQSRQRRQRSVPTASNRSSTSRIPPPTESPQGSTTSRLIREYFAERDSEHVTRKPSHTISDWFPESDAEHENKASFPTPPAPLPSPNEDARPNRFAELRTTRRAERAAEWARRSASYDGNSDEAELSGGGISRSSLYKSQTRVAVWLGIESRSNRNWADSALPGEGVEGPNIANEAPLESEQAAPVRLPAPIITQLPVEDLLPQLCVCCECRRPLAGRFVLQGWDGEYHLECYSRLFLRHL